MPQKFFITHSWKDIEFAKKLCDDLKANGLDGFLDAHSISPGDSIPLRIERGLKECDVYIPIFSPDALKSDWCDWEIDMAITMNRTRKGRPRIIPVIAKPCDVPDRLIHLLYVNFVGWERASIYQSALNDLLTRGFGLSPKPLRPAEPPPVPPGIPAQPQTIPTWLVPAGAVAAVVVVVCALVSFVLGSIINSPTPVPTTQAAVSTPKTVVSTIAPTNTPTLTPSRTDTPRPTATFTPTLTNTPRPPATPTLGIGSMQTRIPDGATMVYVPAGDFTMGSNDYDNEKPPHPVYLDAFWMDKFEVTNALYKKCVDDKGTCSAPSDRSRYDNSSYASHPIVSVSWDDANKYCTWANKKLPTEAQWEKAARGTDGRIYPWGNTFDKNLLNSSEGGKGDTTAVGSYPNGASPYGAMDMAGNVWEWVNDRYGGYSSGTQRNPTGPTSGEYRVLRGGSWGIYQIGVRAASRGISNPVNRINRSRLSVRAVIH